MTVFMYNNVLYFYFSSDIYNLAKKYNAMIFIDECHATGVIGKTGR